MKSQESSLGNLNIKERKDQQNEASLEMNYFKVNAPGQSVKQAGGACWIHTRLQGTTL